MSKLIFHLTAEDEDLLEYLGGLGAPLGYFVVSDTEVKARNAVRRYALVDREGDGRVGRRPRECGDPDGSTPHAIHRRPAQR